MKAPQEQQKRPEAPASPHWVREPQAAPKSETKPTPPHDESHAPDEPGYGHGV